MAFCGHHRDAVRARQHVPRVQSCQKCRRHAVVRRRIRLRSSLGYGGIQRVHGLGWGSIAFGSLAAAALENVAPLGLDNLVVPLFIGLLLTHLTPKLYFLRRRQMAVRQCSSAQRSQHSIQAQGSLLLEEAELLLADVVLKSLTTLVTEYGPALPVASSLPAGF